MPLASLSIYSFALHKISCSVIAGFPAAAVFFEENVQHTTDAIMILQLPQVGNRCAGNATFCVRKFVVECHEARRKIVLAIVGG